MYQKNNFVPPEVDWGALEDPMEAIKRRTRLYRDVSIAEAFSREYGVNLNEADDPVISTIGIGDVIQVTVDAVTKDHIFVSQENSKHYLNLKQGPGAISVTPGDVLTVQIVEKKKDDYVVDVMPPIVDSWLERVKSTLYNRFQSSFAKVHNLQLVRGGYTGRVEVTDPLLKRPHYLQAFVPGSLITLNIESDFDRWVGQTIPTMITTITKKNGEISLVCSRKKYLNSLGGNSLVNIFDMGYGRDGNPFTSMTFDGSVTGILNSTNKQGVFVEVTDFNFTGMIEMNPTDLVNYRIGDKARVYIDKFEWDVGREPYERNRDGILTEVNLKPIFKEVK